MLRRIYLILAMTAILFLFNASVGDANGYMERFSINLHDENTAPGARSTFKFQIVTPKGEVIGFRPEKNMWSGDLRQSRASGECRFAQNGTTKLYEGECYKTFASEALYCPNEDLYSEVQQPEVYSASNYNFSYGCIEPGAYKVRIFPESNAVIKICYSFDTIDIESVNSLCSESDFTKRLIITPNSQSELTLYYDYLNLVENKIEKVITPSLLVDEWEGCNQLGLIRNQGIFTSIDKKLEAAKERCEAGDMKAAANINNAAINEIKAQYGKGIDKLCADILLEDLAFMINK